MHILDKTINQMPWDKMDRAERAIVLEGGHAAPWMFQQKVVLTVFNDEGKMWQMDGSIVVGKAGSPSVVARVRGFFRRIRAKIREFKVNN